MDEGKLGRLWGSMGFLWRLRFTHYIFVDSTFYYFSLVDVLGLISWRRRGIIEMLVLK